MMMMIGKFIEHKINIHWYATIWLVEQMSGKWYMADLLDAEVKQIAEWLLDCYRWLGRRLQRAICNQYTSYPQH